MAVLVRDMDRLFTEESTGWYTRTTHVNKIVKQACVRLDERIVDITKTDLPIPLVFRYSFATT
jgi:hypothetical protein